VGLDIVYFVIVRLEDKIVEVGGSRVQQQQSKLNAVNKEIELLTDATTKAKVSIKTAERCVLCLCVQTHITLCTKIHSGIPRKQLKEYLHWSKKLSRMSKKSQRSKYSTSNAV